VSASSVVVLACKADVAMSATQREALCEALHAALVETAGADRVLPLADGGTDVNGALNVTLRLTRADSRTIEGHLEWTTADNRNGTGPPVVLSVDDMPMGPFLYPSFAAGLLQVSNLPL